jgi:hypothetical protein
MWLTDIASPGTTSRSATSASPTATRISKMSVKVNSSGEPLRPKATKPANTSNTPPLRSRDERLRRYEPITSGALNPIDAALRTIEVLKTMLSDKSRSL